jgi:multimeric flavodoxin WrbA
MRILVIYHSRQFGNTRLMAEALAQGAREGEAEVELINTNERRVTAEQFLAADAVAIGTPDYFSYLAGTIKTFFDDFYLWDQSGKPVKGKRGAFFFSHGGGGRVREQLQGFVRRYFQQVGETVEGRRPITEDTKRKCFEIGKELAAK